MSVTVWSHINSVINFQGNAPMSLQQGMNVKYVMEP